MSLNAATIAVLISKGLTAQDLLEVARATEVKADPTNAERQARHRRKRNAVTVTEAPLNEGPSNPSSSPTEVGSDDTHSARQNEFPRPDWANVQHWKDFLANRRRRRMVNSATAYTGFLGDVERCSDDDWPPGRLLELAARKGWGSINRPDQENRNGHSGPATLRGSRPSPALDMLKRAAAEEAAERGDQAAGGGTRHPLPAIGAG